jgi:hypothetical protein
VATTYVLEASGEVADRLFVAVLTLRCLQRHHPKGGEGGERNRTAVNISESQLERRATYILETGAEVTDRLLVTVFTLGRLGGGGADT